MYGTLFASGDGSLGGPPLGGFDGYSRPAVRPKSLTNYYGSALEGYPRGSSFDFEPAGVKRAPSISGDFMSGAPNGARPSKRPRLEGDSSGLGGDMSYGMIGAIQSMTSAGQSATRIVGGIEFGFPRGDASARATIGFLSNPTIPASEIVLRKEPNYELPGTYDLMIMRQHLPSERQYYKSANVSDFVDETPRCGRTIQAFNHWLAKRQPIYQDAAQYLDAYRRSLTNSSMANPSFDHILDNTSEPWHIFSADDILAYFTVAGIVDTENFTTNVSSVGYLEDGRDQSQVMGGNKKVNMVSYGRADTWNIWGPGLEVHTPLYLILKPVRRPSYYITDSTREMNPTDIGFATLSETVLMSSEAPQIKTQVPDMVWQLIPWADNVKKHPTPLDLQYVTPIGTVAMGKAIRIGYVMKEDYLASDYNPKLMFSNIKAAHQQQFFDIYFQPNSC